MAKGLRWFVKLSNLVVSKLIWSWMVVSLLECSVSPSFRPSILSRMIWKASRGTAENEALLLPLRPPLCEDDGCPSASVSVSIGYSCAGSTSSLSLERWTLLFVIVRALIARGVGMRVMSWGVSTPFSWRILMIRLGRISLGLEVVLVALARMENRWAPMSM